MRGISRREFIKGAVFLVLVPLSSSLVACTYKPLTRYKETRPLMGTFATIIVYSSDEEAARGAIDAAFARMEEIEKVASIFDEEAEAFRLNQDGYLDAPSDDLLKLINMSLDYSELTAGCFDITVQPILELWQAGLYKDSPEVQQNRINETLGLVGWDKIGVEDNKIYFEEEGMKITLGGIAKGYAADEALVILEGKDMKHALVDTGGDIATLGAKPGGEPWIIDLANPDDTSQSLATFLFSDKSVATSGNYERYFDPDKKAHHIINPKTGYSANECISVTVIADSCIQVDAVATAVFVMGPEDGLELVESLDGVECFIVDSSRTIHRSSGLSEYLK